MFAKLLLSNQPKLFNNTVSDKDLKDFNDIQSKSWMQKGVRRFTKVVDGWGLGTDKKIYLWENNKWIPKSGPGQKDWVFKDIGTGWASLDGKV